jgi:hypothetical protein
MPKTASKKQKPEATLVEPLSASSGKPRYLYNLFPWVYRAIPGGMAIEAYVEIAGDWQTVAEVKQTAYLDAEATANYIVKSINGDEPTQKLLEELAGALELCLTCDGLTWEAEQEAEAVLTKLKRRAA